MIRLSKGLRGQSIVETVVLVAVGVLVISAMFGYVRSSIMHQMKSGADAIGHGLRY